MNALIAVALAYTGYSFTKTDPKGDEEITEEPMPKKPRIWDNPNGTDIYNSYMRDENQRRVQDASIQRMEDARKPSKSGIIPNLYNAYPTDEKGDNVYRDRNGRRINIGDFRNAKGENMSLSEDMDEKKDTERIEVEYDPLQFLDREKEIMDSKRYEKMFYDKTKNDSSYIEQFKDLEYDNPRHAVAKNDIPSNTCRFKRLDMERNMALKDGWSTYDKGKNMTYNVTKAQHFVHNNMVPFYSGKGGYGDYDMRLNDVKDQKLELFTGSTNSPTATNFPKHEIAPLFAPQMNTNNINGMPSLTDYLIDRFYVSDTRQGELIFEPVRVNTGLNLDFYEHGEEGFQPVWRPLPKTVDEMRTANNPRISYEPPVIPGMKGDKRPVQAPVDKNRPFAYYENDIEDLLRTLGYIIAPKVRDNFFMPTTRKEGFAVPYVGQAGNGGFGDIGLTGPEYYHPKIRIANKIVYDNAGLRNLTASGSGNNRPNVQVYPNERNDIFPDRTGHFQAQIGQIIPPQDVPAPTRKDMTMFDSQEYNVLTGSSKRPYVPVQDTPRTTMSELTLINDYKGILGTEYKKGKVYDPNDVPSTTMKQLTENYDRSGNAIIADLLGIPHITGDRTRTTMKEVMLTDQTNPILGNNIGRGQAFDPSDIPRTTTKQTTLFDTIRSANMQYPHKHVQTYIQDEIKPTMKQMIIDKDRAGVVTYNMQAGYQTENPFAPTTIKQMIIDKDRAGSVSYNMQAGYQAENPFAPTTLRQMIENSIQGGNVSYNMQAGYQAENPFAPTTLKQMIIDAERAGHIDGTAKDRTGYMSTKWFAPPTVKQSTVNLYYNAPAHADNIDKATIYDTAYNMEINDRKEHVAKSGRAPTTSSYNRVTDNAFTGVRLRNYDNSVRAPIPDAIYNPMQQVKPGCASNTGITTPQESARLDTCLFNTLVTNPYYVPMTDYYQPQGYPNYNLPMPTSYLYGGYENTQGQKPISRVNLASYGVTYT
jgi:hypothetical protein